MAGNGTDAKIARMQAEIDDLKKCLADLAHKYDRHEHDIVMKKRTERPDYGSRVEGCSI